MPSFKRDEQERPQQGGASRPLKKRRVPAPDGTLAAIRAKLEDEREGRGTTAFRTALGWALHHLLGHPELNQELYTDISDTISFWPDISDIISFWRRQGGPIEPPNLRAFIYDLLRSHESGLKDLLPALCQERTFWERILGGGPFECHESGDVDLRELLRDRATADVRSDAELMFNAYVWDDSCLSVVDQSLLRNRGFLEECLAVCPYSFSFLSHETQRRFPDLVEKTFELMAAEEELEYAAINVEGVANDVAPDLWDRRMILNWFQYGLPFFTTTPRGPSPFQHLTEDREIFMTVAECCREPLRVDSFRQASQSLRSDKEFMMEAMQNDEFSSLFPCASIGLQRDFDLALLFFTGLPDWIEEYLSEQHYPGQDAFIESFCRRVFEMLNNRERFCSTFLPGMLPDSGSTLTMLNQDAETTEATRMRIADFLGVPIGRQIRLFREAKDNVDILFGDAEESEEE